MENRPIGSHTCSFKRIRMYIYLTWGISEVSTWSANYYSANGRQCHDLQAISPEDFLWN